MTRNMEWGSTILRVTLGSILFVHGVGKLFGVGPVPQPIPEFTTFLASHGLPGPAVWAWLVGLVEFGGGILLVLGFLTRFAALAVAIDMVGAIVLVHLPRGFAYTVGGYEYAVALLAMALSLVVSGPGSPALTNLLFGGEPFWPRGD
ncbi:DoxX family protein [Halocatena halophila]|uniref:DoxX family protein n=1 Tax=Halocatena halophila TaxID=2814576 RepID=UPI002ED3FFC6